MKYEKPALMRIDSAIAAVQSQDIPKRLSQPDSSEHEPSVAAYEADE